MPQDNIKSLYKELLNTYELGSEDDFRKYLSDGKNREALRKELENDYEVGDSASFSQYLGFTEEAPVTPDVKTDEEYRIVENNFEVMNNSSARALERALKASKEPRAQQKQEEKPQSVTIAESPKVEEEKKPVVKEDEQKEAVRREADSQKELLGMVKSDSRALEKSLPRMQAEKRRKDELVYGDQRVPMRPKETDWNKYLYGEEDKDVKKWIDEGLGINDLWANIQKNAYSPKKSFESALSSLNYHKAIEGERKKNRSSYDDKNFNGFYDSHISPVFESERSKAWKTAEEKVKNKPVYNYVDAVYVAATYEKYTDPEKVINSTMASVQVDNSFSDYVLGRMGLSVSDGNDESEPQLTPEEKRWMQRLFSIESGEVTDKILGRIYDTYKQEDAPKSALDYIAGKAIHDNFVYTLNEALIRRVANSSGLRQQLRTMASEEYGKSQSWGVRMVGGAAPYAVDMLSGGFALPGMAGNMTFKGGMSLLAKQVTKEMEKRAVARGLEGAALKAAVSGGAGVAERYLATQAPVLNVALRAASSAANFATYDMQSEAVRQIGEGGFSIKKLAGAAVHGAALGAIMGAAGGTIAEATKNSGLLGKIGGSVAGLGAETAIFGMSDGLRRAYEEGIDIEDVDWGDTMGEAFGMVVGMKAVGAVLNPRELAQRFRKSQDYDLKLNNRDITELKNAGLNLEDVFKGLGAFGKVTPLESQTIRRNASELHRDANGHHRVVATETEETIVDKEAYDRLLQNPDVSSSTKRKIVYLATGKILSPELVYGASLSTGDDGHSVTTTNAKGEMIETKDFGSTEEAQDYYDKMKSAGRMNTIAAFEELAGRQKMPDILESAKARTLQETGVDVDNAITESLETKEETDAVLDAYIKNLQEVYMERFNENMLRLGGRVDGKPRTETVRVDNNKVEEVDSQGNVIDTHEYETPDDAETGRQEAIERRDNTDMLNDYTLLTNMSKEQLSEEEIDELEAQVVEGLPGYQQVKGTDGEDAFIEANRQFISDRVNELKTNSGDLLVSGFAREKGLTYQDVKEIMEKDPVARTDAEADMMKELAERLHNRAFEKGTLHIEQSRQAGAKAADATSGPDAVPDVVSILAQELAEAKEAYDAFMSSHDDIREAISGMDGVDAIMYVIDNFSGAEQEEAYGVIADYINAQSKMNGYSQRQTGKVEEYVQGEVSRRTLNGEVIGTVEEVNTPIYTLRDGDESLHLVNGNVVLTPEGRIDVDQSSEMVICLDEEGNLIPMKTNGTMKVEAGEMDDFANSLRQKYNAQNVATLEAATEAAGLGGKTDDKGDTGSTPAGDAAGTVATGKTQTGAGLDNSDTNQGIDVKVGKNGVKQEEPAISENIVGDSAAGVDEQGYEDYLVTHPLTEEQIMADTEADEDEKQAALDYLNGDDNAISQLYYDEIFNRTPKTEAKPAAEPESPATPVRSSEEQAEIDAADQEVIDLLNGLTDEEKELLRMRSVATRFSAQGLNLLSLNASQRKVMLKLLKVMSKAGYLRAKGGVTYDEWASELSNKFGGLLKGSLGWNDDNVGGLLGELWHQKYSVNGERKTLEEYSSAAKEEQSVPDVLYDTPENARDRGYKKVNGIRVDRQEEKPMPNGKDVEVQYSTKDSAKGRLTVSELDDIQASHTPNGQKNYKHFIPEAQPKSEFGSDRQQKAQTNASSGKFRPELTLTFNDTQSAYQSSASQTNRRGEVIQGNGRKNLIEEVYAPGNEVSAGKYRRYLKEHAEELGTTPEQIDQMRKPIAHIVLDVDDNEAIRLGQFKASDLESGGREVPQVSTVTTKLGDRYESFANNIMEHEDPDASISERVEKNSDTVVRWLNKMGAISDTEAKTLLENKDLARQFMKEMLTEKLFSGANDELKSMFYELPQKVQNVIVGTIGREAGTSNENSILADVRQSIQAYHEISASSDKFRTIKGRNTEERLRGAEAAINDWLRQINLDGSRNEEKYNNFALELAKRYKAYSDQKTLQGQLNEYYDLVNGAPRQGGLFEEPVKSEKLTKEEAIKRVFNINYEQKKENNGRQDVLAVDSNVPESPAGRQGESGEHPSGKREAKGAGSPVAGGGAESSGEGEVVGTTESHHPEQTNPLKAAQEAYDAIDNKNLEGDSVAFKEKQRKIASLRGAIHEKLEHHFKWADKKVTFSEYKKLAKDAGVDISDTDLQEIIEAEIVDYARSIASDAQKSDEQKFADIVRLYETQPSLNVRDNDRINKQQYSTPAPMAFLMGRFVVGGGHDMATNGTRGLEPSAGNGMLTIALPKEVMHVNDIDEMRLSNLAKQGFAEVTSQDGTLPFGEKKYDIIVTNPPFGNTTPRELDGYTIIGLEQVMAINALDAMKDDGRAAIIIGGNTEYAQNGTIKGKDKAFLNYLYGHYNVVDVINCDGKALYTKQGTGYPVRMILVNGRRAADAPVRFAPVIQKARAERVNSYDELYKRVNDDILQNNDNPGGGHSGTVVDTPDSHNGQAGGQSDVGRPKGHGGDVNQEPVRDIRTGGGGQHDSSGPVGELGVGSEHVAPQTESGADAEKPGGVRGGLSSTNTGGRVDTNDRPSDDEGGGGGHRPAGSEPKSDNHGTNPLRTRLEESQEKRELGTEKVPYRKQSHNPFDLQSQMPAEQAEVVKKSLEEIGDVDEFLTKELGYSSVEDMYHGSQDPSAHGGLAAEQIDSVALAIHQMKNGGAFIIGDQTGIGKGRQGAALIRWGVKQGGNPVYITKNPELFSGVYRDLKDIGSKDLRPFILAADGNKAADITDKGVVVYKAPSKKEKERVLDYISKNGKLPPEYDYLITNYDSFSNGTMDYENGQKKVRNFGRKSPGPAAHNGQVKRDMLEALAGNSYVIMDESHMAGGDSARGNFLQYITSKAKGIAFISATFAKRPDNMPIYALRTAISKAGVDVKDLIDAVKRGGTPFQEVMSKALTEAGQMIRRERDMTGVTIDWRGIEDEAVVAKQREQYDVIIGLFNDIINFQRTYIDPIIDGLNDQAAEIQGNVDHTPGTRDMGINNTPFASKTHQIVKKVLLSLKAEEGAKRAIEHLKAGLKPVIALENTNESAADRVAGNSEGDMEMPDLSISLKEGLQGVMRIRRTDSFGNETYTSIPFDSLSEEARARYQEIMDAINNASSGLSLSPIDVIKNELKKAGYKVGELTGRTTEFTYNEDGSVKRVKRQDRDKKKVAEDFNQGRLDAVILNRSAGTGIDLHAAMKFADQRPRIMVVVQAQADVNDEVQMRGRTDRTGQVQHSMYEYIVSQIPSEQRLLMMLKAKLSSLDANTTSSQKSKFNEMQVQDIINKYGDRIVIEYLAEHPDIYAKMADPLKWGETVFSTPAESLVSSAQKPTDGGDGATASKILGRMALLKVAEQEQMLSDIGELYQAEIDRLNEMGENDLEITEMPLRAKTLKKDVWEQGVEPGGKNPFADNTYVEEVEMDILKKPMKASEVKGSQSRMLNGKSWDDYKKSVVSEVDKWADTKKNELTEVITKRAEKKGEAERAKYVRGAKKNQDKNGMSDAEIEKNGQYQYEHFYNEEIGKLQVALDGVDRQRQAFVDVFETFTTDGVYAIPSNIYDLSGMTFEPSFGKLIDVKISSNFSTAASTISFATLDGRRKITIPVSGMVKQNTDEKRSIFPVITSLTAQTRNGMFGTNIANTLKALEQNTDNWDRLTSTATRKKGYIITGNLLKALVSSRDQSLGGKLISYTTDTGDIRQGLLMPDNFEPKGLTSKTPISSAKGNLNDYEKRYKIESADREVTVRRDDYDYLSGMHTYSLLVPKSKKKGEKYFNDKTLLGLMDGQFEGSGKLKASFKAQNLDAVLKRLDELGVTVEENVGKTTRFRRTKTTAKRTSRQRFVERTEEEADKWYEKSGVPVRLIHSIDEVDNAEVREAIASGAVVYGWYEETNGKRRVCIFMPSCDSEQDVKTTFVHEIVGHEGFRGLFGHDEEAYNEFMRALVTDLKSDGISEYIKEHLKDNGFNIYRTVDEYLAEAAEKGWEDLTFWSKVRYWLIEALRKIGFDFTPSITDTKYMTWLSHHGLDKSDAWKEARRNALLRKLRRERNAAKMENGDFVDWNDAKRADTEEDTQHAKTEEESENTRFKKVEDAELLKKLNEGPTVKRLRAMQIIDGKLYPPMSAKVGKKMREPTEIGVWEQSEERPDKIDKNGNFKLDKAQKGKTPVPAAYNPYFHTSTSGLNDQFTSAYKRPELVVVEVEIPASELTSGYKAQGAKDAVGNIGWHSGVVNSALPKDRQRTVTLSRWSKVVRVVPDSEMADMVAKQLEGTGIEVPYNVVTPNQRKELEARGVKISAKPAGTVTEDINGNPIPKKKTRFRTASARSARDNYEHALRRLSYVWKEAHVDDMQSACELAKAISGVKHVEDIPAHENFIWNANQQSSKEEQLDFMLTKKYMEPLDDVISRILPDMGRNLKSSVRNLQMYMIQKHGLERNRALYVRDWLRAERRATDPLDRSAIDKLNDIEDDYIMLLDTLRQDLRDGKITYRDYLDEIDDFIRGNIDNSYVAEENDYSGLTELMPTNKGYDDAAVCDDVMNTESMLGDRATELWDKTRGLSQYSLDMEYNSGLISKDTYDRVSNMFAFYVPLRGFDEEVAEDRFDYLQENSSTGYIGSVLKNATGRKSLSDVDVIATLGAMASAANRRGLTNQTKQTFARFVRNHYDKDGDKRLVTETGYGWAEKEGIDAYGNAIWKEVFPDIPEDATGDDVQSIIEQFEADMKAKMQAGDAKRIRQKDTIGMKFLDKKHKSQHVVEVYFNGEKHQFVVNGSPRAAQAINGELRAQRGSNLLWMSSLSHFMAKMNTSYSPDFIVRNTERDAIFAFTSLGIKESPKYLAVWTKNYGRMVGRMLYGTPLDGINLFDRYRNGKLNPSNKTDMYFKEFMENGGETGWVEQKNRDKWKKFIERSLRDRKRNKAMKIGEEVLILIPNLIEGVNERAENMARFATYKTSREMGRGIKRSVSDAKEVSVNFNRKGSGKNAASTGRQTNGWFRNFNATIAGRSAQNFQDYIMFYNAGIQAMNNFAKTVGRHPVKGSLALSAFILGGFIAPMLNAYLREILGEDDGKDPYAEIPEWRRRNGLCLYAGDNSFVAVELPIEMRAMYGIGDMAASYIMRPELRSNKGIALDIAGQLSQISPLDFFGEKSGSPLWALVPSGARPVAEAAFNINWQGRPIEREETRWNQNTPRWERAYKGVNDLYINASKRLNAMTNSYSEEDLRSMGVADADIKEVDASIKGWIDGKITDPALVQHVVEGYFGGAGKTANNLAYVYKMFKQGEKWMDIVKSDKAPILRTFHYTPTEQTSYARTKSRWWYYNDETQKTVEEVKRLKNRGVSNPYDKLKALSEEDSVRSLQAKEMERAKKKYDRLNRRMKKEEDPDKRQLTQMEIDALMYDTVELLDSIGGLRSR